MTQPHSLTWGLQFAGPVDPETDFRIDAMADGTNFGNPEALFQEIRSQLTDGSLVVADGFNNREASFRLRLSAPAGIAGPTLAAAEAALMTQCVAKVKPPIIYVPPASDSATCVYDVLGAELLRDTSDGWDDDETRREYRYFSLTLDCHPFVHGLTTTIAPALAPPSPTPTVEVVDTCDATTNWTASGGGVSSLTMGATAGMVYAEAMITSPVSAVIRLRRTASVTMADTPYLRITAGGSLTVAPLLGTNTESSQGPIASQPSDDAEGGIDYWYGPFDTSLGWIEVTASKYGGVGDEIALRIAEVARTNTTPISGTGRQQSRTVMVEGSAPTTAAIRVFDETSGFLGNDVLVYSSSNTDWQPALRPHRFTSATVTADAARVSGARNTLASEMIFLIPERLLTQGTYSLMALMSVTAPGDLTWAARKGGGGLGIYNVTSETMPIDSTDGEYELLELASLSLPVVPTEDPDGTVYLGLSGTSNMTVDEVYLFNRDDGALTWVRNCPVSWVEVRSPELGAPRQSVWGGVGERGVNGVCIDWACESFDAHRFVPGLTQIFTAMTGSLVSQSEIEYYERDHSHRTGSAA